MHFITNEIPRKKEWWENEWAFEKYPSSAYTYTGNNVPTMMIDPRTVRTMGESLSVNGKRFR